MRIQFEKEETAKGKPLLSVIPPKPILTASDTFYLDLWLELHNQRSVGFSMNPVNFSDIHSWMDLREMTRKDKSEILPYILACESALRKANDTKDKRKKQVEDWPKDLKSK